MYILRFNEYSNGQTPLEKAKILGFNTDVIVYHGTYAEFDSFDKQTLGKSTGSLSAKLGFFFGSSRRNSMHYAGGVIEDGKVVVPNYKDITDKLEKALADEGLKGRFELGYVAGSLLFYPSNTLATDTTSDIINAVQKRNREKYNYYLKAGLKYVEDLDNGTIPDDDDEYTNADTKIRVMREIQLIKKSYKFITNYWNNYTDEIGTRESMGNVKEFFLKLGKSYVEDHEGHRAGRSYAVVINKALQEGYDSVIFLNSNDPHPTDVYVVFEPNQIRSTQAAFDLDKADSSNFMD